jgi:hypothetical protein
MRPLFAKKWRLQKSPITTITRAYANSWIFKSKCNLEEIFIRYQEIVSPPQPRFTLLDLSRLASRIFFSASVGGLQLWSSSSSNESDMVIHKTAKRKIGVSVDLNKKASNIFLISFIYFSRPP